ncbi:MAG: PA2169 family four-helix-bundle protein [Chloroflexi bacterium]|nr:PA2169 family four-helix-bundle protein [Chloroflexota bacterium]
MEDQMIGTLQRLHTICKVGAEGYSDAVAAINDDAGWDILRLRAFAARRREHSTALANMLVAMDGDLIVRPGIDLAAELHQIWMQARAAVAGGDRVAVFDEILRGEHYAVDAFEDDLAQPMPREVRRMLTRQHEEIELALEDVTAMRDRELRTAR